MYKNNLKKVFEGKIPKKINGGGTTIPICELYTKKKKEKNPDQRDVSFKQIKGDVLLLHLTH